MRDAVLEGALPSEIEVLTRLSRQPDFAPPADIAERLKAKGWLDLANKTPLLTIAGRTLVDMH